MCIQVIGLGVTGGVFGIFTRPDLSTAYVSYFSFEAALVHLGLCLFHGKTQL